ncbi:MAG: hypothetical protein KDD43_00345 [Bdellovibrionales bacterium]|nr:hypothetical protein [Bdellovibrionales bacterium]
MIGDAQKATLRGQRALAQKNLVRRLESLGSDNKDRPRLVTALNQISRNFLTDRTQAVFESAESLYFSGKSSESLKRYREAEKLEPNNTQIIAALARNLISQDHCTEARSMVLGGLSFNPNDQELRLLEIRTDLCRDIHPGDWKANEETLVNLEAEFGLEAAWYRLLMEDKNGAKKVAMGQARRLLKIDPQFPEPLYLLWKNSPQSAARRNWAASYIATCKKSDQLFRRRYKNEPLLCEWVKVLEEALAKGADS